MEGQKFYNFGMELLLSRAIVNNMQMLNTAWACTIKLITAVICGF
jgi:hypothetical protein